MRKKYIYLLFTNTGTLFTKAIRLYTKASYNHASIALDLSLKEMYSFGRKYPRNPFLGGFVKEETQESFFQRADCSIYACEISAEQEQRLKDSLSLFMSSPENYHYNFIGLFGVMFNKPIHRKNAYFCSQFIAYILAEAAIASFHKPFELITPQDLQQLPELTLIYQGKLQDVMPSRLRASIIKEGNVSFPY
ncbi:hypothetical protein [Gracilibacillus alcaliphilus]|uniref:hypothetical protein n=1 Tax=Gracilibacillus alcaliphilus TaxID=1401441 RepID=UPI00195744F5|nr:hypothetical protein [Gracilibacillus alcaliphilus]MBM7676214.1 hypothetical protein [Gracilibacillus alcaliphilus]